MCPVGDVKFWSKVVLDHVFDACYKHDKKYLGNDAALFDARLTSRDSSVLSEERTVAFMSSWRSLMISINSWGI